MNFYRDDEFIVERNLSRGAKLLLIFMQIYGFEEEGGTRSRTKVLEGERSGRIVKRGARPLLNLLSTVSPLPFLRLARSPFSSPPSPPLPSPVKTSTSHAAKLLLFNRCACRPYHVFVHTRIPRVFFCVTSTIVDVTRHNFDRQFFFSVRINPFFYFSKSTITFGIIARKLCVKEIVINDIVRL